MALFYFMDWNFLRSKLSNGLINSSCLLSQAKLLENDSQNTAAFNDKFYFPFYYHLGSCLKTQNIQKSIQVGSNLGLIGCCFIQGCPTIECWDLLDERSISKSFIESNLLLKTKKKISCRMIESELDLLKFYDVGFISEYRTPEQLRLNLEIIWDRLRPEGLLVVDYIHENTVQDVFNVFCGVKNRIPEKFKTRYGVGIITR